MCVISPHGGWGAWHLLLHRRVAGCSQVTIPGTSPLKGLVVQTGSQIYFHGSPQQHPMLLLCGADLHLVPGRGWRQNFQIVFSFSKDILMPRRRLGVSEQRAAFGGVQAPLGLAWAAANQEGPLGASGCGTLGCHRLTRCLSIAEVRYHMQPAPARPASATAPRLVSPRRCLATLSRSPCSGIWDS